MSEASTLGKRAHQRMLDPASAAYHGPVATLYRLQVQRLRAAVARLQEVDPDWVAERGWTALGNKRSCRKPSRKVRIISTETS